MTPDIPLEDQVDKTIIDTGYEADIDEDLGQVNYWNPNVVDDHGNPITSTPPQPSNPPDNTDYSLTGGPQISLEETKTYKDYGYDPFDMSAVGGYGGDGQ